jgi:molybdopterin molybdotransferase
MDESPLSVDSYRASVLDLVTTLPTEEVPLTQAVNRVASDDVFAVHALPPFDNAAMDGYAVRATDLAGASPTNPHRLAVVGHAPAGHRHPIPVGAGEAVRIMTGARVPQGADLVVPVEQSDTGRFTDDPTVAIWPSSKVHIRRAGEDLAGGAVVASRGDTLGARALALLAATGHRSVRVHRRPRVALITTGDELSDAADAGREGCSEGGAVADSNSIYLRAAVTTLGGELAAVVRCADRQDALIEALDQARRTADLIVSTGGLGAGSHDLVGVTAAGTPGGMLARVAMRPGRPQAHGTWQGVPWIALPGTPTAAFISFEAFVRPALDRLAGRPASAPMIAETVSRGWESRAGTVRYVPLDVVADDRGISVSPAGAPAHAAHALSAMFRAPLIGVVASETAEVVRGQLLPVFEPA